MTDGEIIGLFGFVYIVLIGSSVLFWGTVFTRRAKREQAHPGLVGRFFRLEFRSHWIILLGLVLGIGVGWVATVSHLVVAAVLSVPVLWVYLRQVRRWMTSV
jgi:hypothetical protein